MLSDVTEGAPYQNPPEKHCLQTREGEVPVLANWKAQRLKADWEILQMDNEH